MTSPTTPQAFTFTCVTCHVAFSVVEGQRTHYKSEWHMYNLKRKVAQLGPVGETDFQARQAAQLQKQEAQPETSFVCLSCSKTYSSDNAYQNHLLSKKHKELAAKPIKEGSRKQKKQEGERYKPASTVLQNQIPMDTSDLGMSEEEIKTVDAEIANKVVLDPEDCLFCSARAETFDANLHHMTHSHGFFIPDLEYLENLEGLIAYLADKISVGNTCLYCNGKGKSFHSLDAVRKHMVDKAHCKILYEGDAADELAPFYDFSSTYPDYNPDDDNDTEIEEDELTEYMLAHAHQVQTTNDTNEPFQMVLANGTKIGHRSMQRYYKQKFAHDSGRTTKSVTNLMGQYRALGWHANPPQAQRQLKNLIHREQKKRQQLGIKANKLSIVRPQVVF
eukprot:NODE_607_length_1330_cov_19.062344_g568_i0.p1 GENE.NODE_607_length_1330_cov_19.062344_g568_i0~~NODE_607_length_1330_cov_19.062344_g568_i0.p1  ORF type:complete len:390 (+),score=49.81 NODE_607_length_1330_cov_19.062344_g568_i0:96-1265(+)